MAVAVFAILSEDLLFFFLWPESRK